MSKVLASTEIFVVYKKIMSFRYVRVYLILSLLVTECLKLKGNDEDNELLIGCDVSYIILVGCPVLNKIKRDPQVCHFASRSWLIDHLS